MCECVWCPRPENAHRIKSRYNRVQCTREPAALLLTLTSVISPKREKTSVSVISSASCGSMPTNSLFSLSTGVTREFGPSKSTGSDIQKGQYHVTRRGIKRDAVSNNISASRMAYFMAATRPHEVTGNSRVNADCHTVRCIQKKPPAFPPEDMSEFGR